MAAYFCHNTYVAEVLDLTMQKNLPVIQKVYAAVDCGIVINPDAAANMGEGGIVDGIGNALFGELTFVDGVPEKNNFNKYQLIRQKEAPKSIEVHFVKNDKDPTGLGEPLFPPIFTAVANALYKATAKKILQSTIRQGHSGFFVKDVIFRTQCATDTLTCDGPYNRSIFC